MVGSLRYALLLAVPRRSHRRSSPTARWLGKGVGSDPTARPFSPASRGSTRPEIAQPLPHEGRNLRRSRGRVAARNIAAEIDGGPGDRFDGTGYCFLEFPGQRASALEGHFFAQPPEVRLAEPNAETFARSGLRNPAAPQLAGCRHQLSYGSELILDQVEVCEQFDGAEDSLQAPCLCNTSDGKLRQLLLRFILGRLWWKG